MREADVRGLLDFVAEAESAVLSDRGQLTNLVVDRLTTLIPSDLVACVEGQDRGAVTTAATDPGLLAARERDSELWLACFPQHPYGPRWLRTGHATTARLSDLLSQRAYRRLPIYHYFFRPFGIEYDLCARVVLSPEHCVVFGCSRTRRDFTERDLALLETLRPYLASILRRAEAGRLAQEIREGFGLTRREGEVLALVARGKSNGEIAEILFLSPGTVRKHLERIYPKLGVTTRTQAAMRALRAREGQRPLGELLRTVSLHPLDAFGLTHREVDVLALVSEGSGNMEIAEALALAPGTVKKHLDHIYAKLGVSGRAEAVSRALCLGLLSERRKTVTEPATIPSDQRFRTLVTR